MFFRFDALTNNLPFRCTPIKPWTRLKYIKFLLNYIRIFLINLYIHVCYSIVNRIRNIHLLQVSVLCHLYIVNVSSLFNLVYPFYCHQAPSLSLYFTKKMLHFSCVCLVLLPAQVCIPFVTLISVTAVQLLLVCLVCILYTFMFSLHAYICRHGFMFKISLSCLLIFDCLKTYLTPLTPIALFLVQFCICTVCILCKC